MKANHLIIAAAALLLTATSCGKGTKAVTAEAEAEAAVETVAAPEVGVTTLDDDAKFRPGAEVPGLVVLDFNATWCIPCKKLTPAFVKASDEFNGKAEFYAVDIDNNPETAKAFGIESIPTVIFLLPNGEMQRFVGLGDFASDEQLSNKDLSEAELTDIIYSNMQALINKALE